MKLPIWPNGGFLASSQALKFSKVFTINWEIIMQVKRFKILPRLQSHNKINLLNELCQKTKIAEKLWENLDLCTNKLTSNKRQYNRCGELSKNAGERNSSWITFLQFTIEIISNIPVRQTFIYIRSPTPAYFDLISPGR